MISMKIREGAEDRENRSRPETTAVPIRELISRESCTRCTSFPLDPICSSQIPCPLGPSPYLTLKSVPVASLDAISGPWVGSLGLQGPSWVSLAISLLPGDA